jgi:hypothetical protein
MRTSATPPLDSPELAPPPPSFADAQEILAGARRLESRHVGEAGTPSKYLAALARILEEHDANTALEDIARRGTTAGRLYAVMGLYFLDGAAFAREAQRLYADGGEIKSLFGCIGASDDVRDVLDAGPQHVGIGLHQSLKQVKNGLIPRFECDVVGGCLPLMLVGAADGSTPAPRDSISLGNSHGP